MNYHITDTMTLSDNLAIAIASFYTIDTAKYVFRHADDKNPTVGLDVLGWHYHTCYELLYFLRGDADYQIEQRSYTLRPHSLLIIKPGEYHNMFIKSNKRLDRIVIHFNENDLSAKNREILSTLGNVYCIPGTRLSD